MEWMNRGIYRDYQKSGTYAFKRKYIILNEVKKGGSLPIKGTLAVGSPGHGIENEDMIIVMKRMAKMMVVVSQSPGMRLGGQDQASHATGSQSGCFFLQIKVFKFFRGVSTSQFQMLSRAPGIVCLVHPPVARPIFLVTTDYILFRI